jgi:hypothetical protein
MGGLNNQDIFLYALYRLDGAGRFIHVEDVVQECWRLSPSRFGWRKLEYPSDKIGWAAVGHIEERRPELLRKSPKGLGRQLTAEGVAWVRSRLAEFERLAAEETKAPKTRRASFKLVSDFIRHQWVAERLAGERPRAISRGEAATILRCAPDSPIAVWQQRLDSLRSAAADNERPEVVELLEQFAREHPDWFTEDRDDS